MKKLYRKIKKSLLESSTKLRWMLLTKTERKMMGVSAIITEEYTKSRAFRRSLEGTSLGAYIKETLKNW